MSKTLRFIFNLVVILLCIVFMVWGMAFIIFRTDQRF